MQKMKVWLITAPDGSRNFIWVARTLMIKQDQGSLKLSILKSCFKSW